MTDVRGSTRSAVASAGSFLGTFALVFAAIAGLFAVDTILADQERAASRSEARRLFEQGLRLEQRGATHEAVDRLRSAVSAERQNAVYQRALAAALLDAGELDDARGVLTDRLQHDPLDAEASLIMARALARERRNVEAIAFYHRAIYGRWDDRAAVQRVRARFELAELLASTNARQALLAELLPLRAEAPGDAPTQKRIGWLFLAAGSPARAAEIFREIVRRDGSDADAYRGLGEAELQRGNYRAARMDYATAVKLAPDDSAAAARLELSTRVLALDPGQRGLGTAEQYRRSLVLLGATFAAVEECAAVSSPPRPPALLDTVRALLGQPLLVEPTAAAVDDYLSRAKLLWESRPRGCPAARAFEPVALVLTRLEE